MSSQMQTLSCRLPSEDIAWISALPIAGATTASDKLRALIGQIRRQNEGTLDYSGSVSWLRELIAPFVNALRDLENRHRMHSAAINAIVEWTPVVMATMLSERGIGARDAEAKARQLEEALLQRAFQLLTTLMRLGVTRQADCYDPGAIERHLPKVLELAELISAERRRKEG
jgi:hypothetical protein